jgi:carboxypeptidase Taq
MRGRVARRNWERAASTELAAEPRTRRPRSYQAWVEARERRLRSVPAWLERMVELRLRWAECVGPGQDPYDVLLDEFEEGLRTEGCTRSSPSAAGPTALVAGHANADADEVLAGPFANGGQHALSRESSRPRASWDAFRLDLTVHPFRSPSGRTTSA